MHANDTNGYKLIRIDSYHLYHWYIGIVQVTSGSEVREVCGAENVSGLKRSTEITGADA